LFYNVLTTIQLHFFLKGYPPVGFEQATHGL